MRHRGQRERERQTRGTWGKLMHMPMHVCLPD